MWIFTQDGFYSAVQFRGDPASLLVRARCKKDLETLVSQICELSPTVIKPSALPIIEGAGTDYPYRVTVPRDLFALWIGAQVGRIEYGNFKSRVFAVAGITRELIYSRVWAVLRQLENL